MKKENKFLIIVILISIIALISIVFYLTKYPTYKSNLESEKIVIKDNEDLKDTKTESKEQDIIKNDNEIGTLTIPDIELENAPIRESIELDTLSKAIGHFPSTAIYEGNVGLASHNSGGKGDFFKNLKKIKIGSCIFYQTKYATKRYVVTVKEVINEDDWSYLGETEENRITLITCIKGKRDKRLCVQAVETIEGINF